jgi:adenylate kinase
MLIREQLGLGEWSTDKLVGEIERNQLALASAVHRYNEQDTRLILDGHFVLLDAAGGFCPLAPEVFEPLNISGVVLVEASPETILARVRTRDGRRGELCRTGEFLAAERLQASFVCEKLGIPIVTLDDPSPEVFLRAVSAMAGWVKQ